jgi:NDP-4-keto-2,6-dideoxyhexose 3-C-methyltransferase
MSESINCCRICESINLTRILDLGEMELTGVFPESKTQKITSGPLRLVKCSNCGLVQLDHNFPLTEMYGDNYGYRSGLNNSMKKHLENSVKSITSIVSLQPNDVVLDIGSNDGTLLSYYPEMNITLVGMDPTIKKFKDYYKPNILKIADFFSSNNFFKNLPDKKAKIITSFSMFYDLEKPQQFVNEIKEILAPDGVWVFEQSYLPTMMERLSFDTICHEHLEYYCLEQIVFMLNRANLKIIDIKFNDINGGSFVVYAAHKDSDYISNDTLVTKVLANEKESGYQELEVYAQFEAKVFDFKKEILNLIREIKQSKKTIVALGASTKGNVLLQFCNLDSELISAIGEVNSFKFGKFSPKTLIPIMSEEEINRIKPDYKLILPWHFRDTFLKRERDYVNQGGKIIFPLPKIEIVTHID